MHNIFRQIVAEFPSAAEYRNVMLNSLLQQLLVLIYRCEPLSFSPVHEDLFNVDSRIQHQFESQYHKTYNISDLARENSLSASYLSHVFKEISGTSVMNYLQSCRIAAAKKYSAVLYVLRHLPIIRRSDLEIIYLYRFFSGKYA